MKRYPNGEIVTKDRIQDEDWYPDYQSLMESCFLHDNLSPDEVIDKYVKRETEIMGEAPIVTERLLRWAVLHAERTQRSEEEIERLNKLAES